MLSTRSEEVKSLKIYWNGIKINGRKELIKCDIHFERNGENNGTVIVYAENGDCLPVQIFHEVENESNYYTDLFDEDHCRIYSNHPLYKYFCYAAMKSDARSEKRFISYAEKRIEKLQNCTSPTALKLMKSYQKDIESHETIIEEFEKLNNPGQPSEDEVKRCVDSYNEAQRIAKEEAMKAEFEEYHNQLVKFQAEKNETHSIISNANEAHPLKVGESYVSFLWSECPGFYDLCDEGSGKKLDVSLKAADEIIKKLNSFYQNNGSQKTGFRIVLKDGFIYTGRFYFGEEKGGLQEHIEDWIETLKSYAGKFGSTKEQDLHSAETLTGFSNELKNEMNYAANETNNCQA